MIEKLDADLGRLLDAVESRDDDTLVLFTSDHGEGSARHKRVQKWHPFEQSVKVPFIAWMPGRIKSNVIDRKHIVSGIDIMTTVCEYAGIPAPPNCKGKRLKQLLENGETTDNMDFAVVEFQPFVRLSDWLVVRFFHFRTGCLLVNHSIGFGPVFHQALVSKTKMLKNVCAISFLAPKKLNSGWNFSLRWDRKEQFVFCFISGRKVIGYIPHNFLN